MTLKPSPRALARSLAIGSLCLGAAMLSGPSAAGTRATPTTSTANPSSAQRQPFTAERSWQIQRLGAPTVSPDGQRVLAPVTRYAMAEDRGETDLWQWGGDGQGQRRFTTSPSNETSPTISPDGRQVAFIAQREGDKAPQLYVMPLDGGEAVRLTQLATGVQSPRWFPDGQRLAFVSRIYKDLPLAAQGKRLDEVRASKMTAKVYEGVSVTAWDQYLDERECHVFAVPLAGGEPQALTLPTGLSLPRNAVQGTDSHFAISPDGLELAFVADADPAGQNTNLDVFTVKIGQKEARNVTEGNVAHDTSPSYSPDGRHLSFVQQRVPRFYADKGRLMVLDRLTQAVRELYPEWDRSAGNPVWAADSQRLYSSIDDAGVQRVYELPLRGKPRALTGQESVHSLALSRSGALFGLRETFIEPPTLVKIDPATGHTTKLSTVNDELLAATDFGTYESVTYTGAEGHPIQMWVNYPPGFDKSRRHPFFMLIHGGPHNGITNGMSFRWNAQVFGSWGYVTAWPNFHGSSGFGQAFTDAINPNWADLPYEDVIKAADWFAAQPWIDPQRMVAGGGSYGGYLTTLILGRKHPFKALLAHAAVYNLYSQYAADFSAEKPRFGGFWEKDNDQMLRHTSPHLFAANFKTPTLVVHGQTDLRVPVNHGLELYHTLLNQGVPSRLVYYTNENHWVLHPQNSVFWYQQVRQWFEQHNPASRPSRP